MTPEDHQQVLDLIHRTVPVLNSVDYTPDQIEIITTLYTPQELSLWKTAYVALEGDRIIGVIGARQAVWRSDRIQGLFVDPAYIRRKVGSRLLETFEQICDARELITIDVGSSLTALKFYQAHGYEIQGHSNDPVPTVSLEKRLRPGDLPIPIFQGERSPNTEIRILQLVLIVISLVILWVVILLL